MYSAYKLNKQGFRLHPPSKHQKPAHFWYSSHVQQRCQDNKRWAQLVPVGRVSNLQTVGGTSTLDISPYLQANPLSRCRSQGHKTQGSSCSLELSQLWRPLSPSISSDYSPLWFRQASEGLVTVKFLTPLLGLRLPIINRRGKKWHCGKCLIADSTLFKDSRQWACPSVEGKKKKKRNLETEGLPFILEDSVSQAPGRWGLVSSCRLWTRQVRGIQRRAGNWKLQACSKASSLPLLSS